MSGERKDPCVSAQILDEVRLYLEKFYEEPEELLHGACPEPEGITLEEDAYTEEAFEAADKECVSFDVEETPREKRKKPGLFAARKTGAAKESAPAASDEAFMGAADSAPAFMPGRKLDDVIGDLDKSFMELVWEFADRKGITEPELQKKAGIDRKAYSKLKCGTTKNPSKSTALAIAIALELSLDDTKDLLSRAGLALSPCSKQDLIVRYFIEKESYDMFVINYTLDEYGELPLGSH